MSIFFQNLNPNTGLNDWILQEHLDYHQEVARSSFADMLHDTERNQKYEVALKAAISTMHKNNKKANVLDIGTGTGLLSMMAVRHGADSVTACEAFKPMSECALRIIKRNGFQDKIKIIPKRSTDLTIGPDGDLLSPCNILVTEVFDTELIGEGALSTFNHAHKVLMEKDCIVVPHSATVYAQLVESPFVQNWNKLEDVYDNEGKLLIKIPPGIRNCAGSIAVHDLQMNQLKMFFFKFLTSPIPVFRFDWSGKTPFIYEQTAVHRIKVQQRGIAQAVFMWWNLQMDIDGKEILSCAPYWAHPLSKENHEIVLPWRDHWMQAIYYLPQELLLKNDKEISLISCHDEYSLWFSIKSEVKLTDIDYLKPICECGLHQIFSRTRIGQINDSTRNKKYVNFLERTVDENSKILVLGDGFYSSLCASQLGAKNIYYLEMNFFSRKILQEFIRYNEIKTAEIFETIECLQSSLKFNKINIVIGEPYFLNSILPWDNLMFMFYLKEVRNILTNDVEMFPQIAAIKGIPVKFNDLHKIRLPVRECEGFIMTDFDDLIEVSRNISDDIVEAQPLWEYPGIALSKPVDIMALDFHGAIENVVEVSGVLEIEENFGPCNGIALWVDWLHGDNKSVISSGPIVSPEVGQKIEWDYYTRQGVCLFCNKQGSEMKYICKFDLNQGKITFKFN